MSQNQKTNSSLNKSSMINHNTYMQNSFKQTNLKIRNRNRFMSSDSNLLIQTPYYEVKNTFLHDTNSNFQNFNQSIQSINQNPQHDFFRNSLKDDETNSFLTDQSSNKTLQNCRKRDHALRKQVNDSSLSKLKRNSRRSFLQRLNDFKLTQNSSFNRISWEEYQSGEWMIQNQPQSSYGDFEIVQSIQGSNQIQQNQVNEQHDNKSEDDLGHSQCENVLNSDYFVKNDQEEQVISQKDSIQSQESIESQIQYFPNQGSLVIPQRKIQDFIPFIKMENKLHDDFNPGDYEKNPNQNYESRYQIYYPRNSNDPRISTKVIQKTLQGFKIISINCGKNLNNLNKKIKKKSFKTKAGEDMRQMIIVILNYMIESYDFILLQQACDPIFQQHLLKAIVEFNRLKGDIYFFPQHLPRKVDGLRTTTILTKHQVKMGQFNFKLPDFQMRLPTQTFCEFRVKIKQQWENVCIFCCHLKSSKGHKVQLFTQIRKQQVDAIESFGKKYDRFFCIGDTNIPSSFAFDLQNNYVSSKFYDAIYYGISEYRGTYLFKNPKGKVVEERIDRVWLNRQSALTTSVLINYHDILLEACEDLELDQIKMLQKANDVHPYITVTDHTILDIEIMFTK